MEMRASIQDTLGEMEFQRLWKEGSECLAEDMTNRLLNEVLLLIEPID